jgi:hypothetical protein
MLKVSNTLFDTLDDNLVGERLQHDRAFYIVQVYAALLSPVSVTILHKDGSGSSRRKQVMCKDCKWAASMIGHHRTDEEEEPHVEEAPMEALEGVEG